MADDLPVGCRGCDRYHRHARYDCDDCIDLAGAGTTKRKPCRSCGEYKYLGHFESRVKCQSCLTLSPAKVASLSCSHVQHTRTRTQTHIYTRHTHTHIHTHTHKHTHTHTHTHLRRIHNMNAHRTRVNRRRLWRGWRGNGLCSPSLLFSFCWRRIDNLSAEILLQAAWLAPALLGM